MRLDPSRDFTGITAVPAAKLVKELAGLKQTTTPTDTEKWERLT